MTVTPKVSIIVLSYNGKHFLEKCLQTIQAQTYQNLETVVIDNNSNDGSAEYAESLTGIVYIKNQSNFGYAKANNIGAEKATGEFLLILNNDTELFPDTIALLVKNYAEQSILVPMQIVKTNSGQVEFAGNGADIFGYPYGARDPADTKVFYADGAAIFIRRSDFLKIGKFDDLLFMFQEDIDFSWRAKMFGYSIKQAKSAKFYHYSGGAAIGGNANKGQVYTSSYFRRYQNEKNVIRNMLKNYSIPFLMPLVLLLSFLHMIEILILLITGKLKIVQCYFRAYLWNIKNFKNTLQFRKFVQSNRRIGDFALIKQMYWSYSKAVAFTRVGGLPKFK